MTARTRAELEALIAGVLTRELFGLDAPPNRHENRCAEKIYAALDAAGALAGRELQAYRDAAMYDPDMSGQARFKAWNRSQLDRARALTEAATHNSSAPPPEPRDD